MSVFSELFKLWPQFLAFRSSVEDKEVLPELENRRVKQRARVLRRRRKEEEAHDARRAQVDTISEGDSESNNRLVRRLA